MSRFFILLRYNEDHILCKQNLYWCTYWNHLVEWSRESCRVKVKVLLLHKKFEGSVQNHREFIVKILEECENWNLLRNIRWSLISVSHYAKLIRIRQLRTRRYAECKMRSNKKPQCCSRTVSKENIWYWNISQSRTIIGTKKLILMLSSEGSSDFNIVEKLKQRPIMSVLPLLSTVSLLSVQKCVDIYSIFRFEPMNSLSQGVTKLSKEVCTSMLSNL